MLGRHSRAWLTAPGWRQVLCSQPSDVRADLLAWSQAGWPAVARRADADAGDDEACLGIALPPLASRARTTRVALRVPRTEVAMVMPPLALDSLASVIPRNWRAAYASLCNEAAANALALKVFGSVAWQAMTGMDYIKPSSDIDLLFYPRRRAQLQQALALFQAHAQHLPIDGEMVFPTGDAVSWKEWAQAARGAGQDRVLAKGERSVRLLSCAGLLATLEADDA